jgi:transposase-like protein
MPSGNQYPTEHIVKAVRECGGSVTDAAKALGCARNTIAKRADKEPEIREAIHEAREALLDEAEKSLLRAVKNGEGWAVCFTLKTQGKSRGYVERQQVEDVTEPQPVELKLSVVDGVKP